MPDVIDWCERGLVPDALMRAGMRRMMAGRLAREYGDRGEDQRRRFMQRLHALAESLVALHTEAANEQHYEVPAAFYQLALGRHLKYSACLWPDGVADLDTAEARMLEVTCERAGLAEGQRILELGCGWGSLTLWMAERYAGVEVTAVSNSASQKAFIESRARERGLDNVRVVTADMNDFDIDERFDRVVSIEMFEHMRNYRELLRRIAGWLLPGGRLFVHIFCHRELMYPFETDGDRDWMARHFFTGGLMPAEDTLVWFQDDLRLVDQWRVDGRHYQKTSEAWLGKLDSNRDAALAIFRETYGEANAQRWLNRWRMFFMAVAEFFGYADGREWYVGHYLFERRTG